MTCRYPECDRQASGLFTMFPQREPRPFCAAHKARLEAMGLWLAPVNGWVGRATRSELPPRVEMGR